MTTATQLDWKKRARHSSTDVARITTWETAAGRYRLARHRYTLLLDQPRHARLPDAWFALVWRVVDGRGGWDILGRHRKRSAALQTIDRHYRAGAM